MKSARKDKDAAARSSMCIGKISRFLKLCWICTAAAVLALLLVGIQLGLVAKFRIKGVDVLPSGSGQKGCRHCDMAELHGEGRIGRWRGGDETGRRFLADGEKFMYYAPHSGFNNQVVELRNALVVAKILNRTLIVPPVLDHHAAWLGSCPKRRVLRPYRLRALVWTRILDLITNSSGRYTSIADIVDISSVTPSKVKTIDLRVFLALWCGVDIRASCGGSLCKEFAEGVFVWREYESCIRLLNPEFPKTEQSSCVFSVDNDCTSTLWTINPKSSNKKDSLLANAVEELHRKSPIQRSSEVAAGDKVESRKLQNVRRRALLTVMGLDEWKAEKSNASEIKLLNIRSSIGPNSSAGNYSVLAFGSMFSMSYKNVQSHIDIRTPAGDKDLDNLLRSLRVLPFASEIVAAGKQYIFEELAWQPFYCAQLRLLDGQFKNHWNATFQELKGRLRSYNSAHGSRNFTSLFVMTDLPSENWNKTDLKELLDPRNLYEVHKLGTRNDLIQLLSRKVLAAESGFLVGSGSAVIVTKPQRHQVQPEMSDKIPHVELAMEEIVCSCARLGFSGTHGSTIADSIKDLRTTGICGGLKPGFETPASTNA